MGADVFPYSIYAVPTSVLTTVRRAVPLSHRFNALLPPIKMSQFSVTDLGIGSPKLVDNGHNYLCKKEAVARRVERSLSGHDSIKAKLDQLTHFPGLGNQQAALLSASRK